MKKIMAILGGLASAWLGYWAFMVTGLSEACGSPLVSFFLGAAFIVLCLLSYTGGRTAAN